MDDKLLYKIALSQVDKIGSKLAKILISYCGSPEEIFKKSESALIKIPGINSTLVRKIKDPDIFRNAEHIIKKHEINKINTYFYLDEGYPSRLKQFEDCPIILFTQGNNHLNDSRTLGIVGTRSATKRGKYICENIVEQLSNYNITIVSGLALGIDAKAHRSAIKYNIPNIAIMGSGINITYPAEHENLRDEIVNNGDVVSEFPLDKSPEKGQFPMRNRIIAQLSDALLVVESDIKGGAMITAKLGFGYNKDIFAVPGRYDDKYSKGTNWLIKSNIAKLTDCGQDISNAMNWNKKSEKTAHQMTMFVDLEVEESMLVDILKRNENENISIDELHYLSGKSLSELSGLLLNLEFKGVIDSLPGSRYVLINK